MKMFTVARNSMLLVVAALLASPAAGVRLGQKTRVTADTRPITKVVRMLEAMDEKSKADGDKERVLYAKYKCYCDDNEEQKKAEIESLKSEIELLASKIEEIRAETGILSKEAAAARARIEEIEIELEKLKKIRDDERKEFLALKADLEFAIKSAKDAIEELASVGADQTSFGAAAGHTQYMADFSGVQLKDSVKRAAAAALASGHTDEASKLNAFLQRKFTGTYSSQAGEVIGIIKNMRDTFETELSTAQAKEDKAEATYRKVKAALEEEKKLLEERETEIQGTLGGNDGDLQTKKKEKQLAEEALADAEAFLEELLDLCAKKKAEYEKRVELRNQEEAAISEAIAILNSDAAFEAFGKVDGTSGKTTAPQSTFTKTSANVVSFNFLQIANVRNNLRNSQAQGMKALSVLRKSASEFKSLSMARIAALLEANNPFTTVLEAIEEMLGIIKEEGETDLEKKEWCVDEQTKKEADLGVAEANIVTLKSEILTLDKAINDPVTGLKKKISDMEDGLRENTESMTQQTADRKSDNLAYQQNIADLVEAKDLLQKAIVVLKAYYEEAMQTEGTGFIQIQQPKGPTPPKTWDAYEGQSNEASGGRTTAIGMLEFILANTKKEETTAHEFENQNQQDYEESMQEHKEAEAKMQEELADLQGELAEKEKELLDKQKDLEKEEALAASIKKYLAEIEPGCTFIKTNIAERDRARDQESKALKEARDLLKETPAYKEAVELGTNETLGDCADVCHGNEDHVDCKACVAKVSVPGYCAGHPETDGC